MGTLSFAHPTHHRLYQAALKSAIPIRDVTPVPRLILISLRVVSRIREFKSKLSCLLLQPEESCCLIETGIQQWCIQLAQIHGTSGVVFAETGRGRNTKYVFDLLARIQFASNDFNLAINTAVSRNDEQADTGLEGSIFHATPCGCRFGYQPVFPTISANFCQIKMHSLNAGMQATRCNQFGRNAQFLKPLEYQGF